VVVCAPIEGSVILHDCERTTLFLAARQVRLHTSTDCAFYVRALSRPIIEHCRRVRFAPNTAWFEGMEEALRGAGLHSHGEEARARQLCEMWSNVDDFGWHKVQQSPHWRVVPAAERWTTDNLPAALRERGVTIVAPPPDLAPSYFESPAALALAALPWDPEDVPKPSEPSEASDPFATHHDDDDEL
jgi:Tubulin binding cofactor C